MEEYYDNIDVCINEHTIDVAGIVKENKEQEQRELEEKLYNLQCSAPVRDIDDLLWKYEEYNIKVLEDVVIINQPVAYKRFLTLKKDMTKLGLTKVIVDA